MFGKTACDIYREVAYSKPENLPPYSVSSVPQRPFWNSARHPVWKCTCKCFNNTGKISLLADSQSNSTHTSCPDTDDSSQDEQIRRVFEEVKVHSKVIEEFFK
jgi:hypothetical protein